MVLLLLLSPFSLQAQNEITPECVDAIRDIYRFYFHEISPNPRSEACKKSTPEKLDQKAILEMQVIITDLKQNCPAPLIAQINNSFPSEG